MFTQTWRKYIPVLHIIMKRSSKEDQSIKLNEPDFKRAAGGRKTRFSFSSTVVRKGKVEFKTTQSPVANQLIAVLLESEQTRDFMRNNELEFSMSNDFELLIKNITPTEVVSTEESSEEAS